MEYTCKKVEQNLLIDGNLNKKEWKDANSLQLIDTVSGKEINYKTNVKLLWNDNFLYAGFECEEDYIYATMTNFNDMLYEEDVVELFLDDDKDGKTYIEIEVNPLNAVLHYAIHNDLKGKIVPFERIENNITSEVIYNEKEHCLTVELAIPFTEFVTAKNTPPKIGDSWLFNAYRINHTANGEVEYYAGAKTGIVNFHKPESFGELLFNK